MKELDILKREMTEELRGNILPFWAERMRDDVNGGFCGRMTGEGKLIADAPKGVIMYGRILWTFSAAYRIFGDTDYLNAAVRAKNYLLDHFYDREFGGVYWKVDAAGHPLDTKKQFYALGFAIYGLSEYHRATGDSEALQYAISLFESIEEHSFDSLNNGYIEAATREWSEMDDVRLSEKDENERKTMNTHLHILEPYTNLYRIWQDDRLRKQLRNLIGIFTEKIYSPYTGHLGLFFDDGWHEKSIGTCSYGHDIEASWLILEAAIELGNRVLIEKIKPVCERIADAGMEGYRPDGSMVYEMCCDGRLDADRHWWVQAETVVGLFWLWKFHGRDETLVQAVSTWNYIKRHLVDYEKGEWFWSIRGDGSVNRDDDKAGFWKCPYHNGRMCMELISLI